jgi:hypothetical protein
MVLLGLMGCIVQKAPPYPYTILPPDPYLLYQTICARFQTIDSLKGLAEVHIKQGNKTFRVEEIVVLKKPGSLRVETVDFWGQTIFIWIVHKGEWITFDAPDNRYTRGQSAIDVIHKFIGFAWNPEVMVNLLAGDPLYAGITQPEVHISRDEGYVLLDVEDKNNHMRYLVWVGDGALPARSLLVTAPANSPYSAGIQIEYSHYNLINGINFPFSFVVSVPCQDSGVIIDYESLSLNCSLEEEIFNFQPPPHTGQKAR